ncbi:MAG: hypothetical protein LBS21_07270 [Clostridiales bacterium]|jgi:hypothetical protein|nr:hypothetical protein [Clostridiales bacterium]
MVQTYQGYFREDGRFVSDSLQIKIPAKRRTVISVFEDEIAEAKTRSQRQSEALDTFLKEIKAVTNETITDDDYADLENNRVNFRRELNL